jgi:hypothetical protein
MASEVHTCDHEEVGPAAPFDERRTLQFGPLWVLTALAGTYSRFADYELEAFWDAVVEVALRTPEPARGILTSTTEDRASLLLDFGRDGRPVVSGLFHVVSVLERLGPPMDQDYRSALMRIGTALARVRGPYGRRVTEDDEQKLQLVAALLEIESAPPEADGMLVP